MAILVSDIQSGIDETEQDRITKAVKILGVREAQVLSAGIYKTSVDARKRKISFVTSVLLELSVNEKNVADRLKDPHVVYKPSEPLTFHKGDEKLRAPIVIAGFGPAGMFAALVLSEQGYSVTVLERGSDVDARTKAVGDFWKTGRLNLNSNVQFGEGGAGTFSDGKLTTRISDPRCSYVLEKFAEFGAPREILTKAKPHIGTDYLKSIVKNIRQQILASGGTIRFDTALEQIVLANGGTLSGVIASGEKMAASALVLAIGHSARDVFAYLLESGFVLLPKPFSVGVRIEHLQSEVDRALYHDLAGHPNLPKGEYQLSLRQGDEAVYTFCMCPGGFVVPSSSESGGIVVNGMSEFARGNRNANSALVVAVDPKDYGSSPLDGIAYQRDLEQRAFQMGGENYCAPVMTVDRYLSGGTGYSFGRVEPSYALGAAPGDFDQLFSSRVNRMLRNGLTTFGRKQNGFDTPDSVLTGVETRTSSPVRIERDETLQAVGKRGVYPCGEGAGYAGGIMSAAVDGIRVAEEIMKRYAPNLK